MPTFRACVDAFPSFPPVRVCRLCVHRITVRFTPMWDYARETWLSTTSAEVVGAYVYIAGTQSLHRRFIVTMQIPSQVWCPIPAGGVLFIDTTPIFLCSI